MTSGQESTRRGPHSNVGQDVAFVSSVVLLSASPYIWRVGFYSDQWNWLAHLGLSSDQTFAGLLRSMYRPSNVMRPVEALHFTSLYWLFGMQPLGYQMANSLALALIVALFYLAMRGLGMPRVLALALPTTFGLLPHYSTVRFWSFATPLSMALYFVSLNADFKLLRAEGSKRIIWRFVGLAALLGSALSYELMLPFFLLNPLIVMARESAPQHAPQRSSRQLRKQALMFLPNLLVLAVLTAYKTLTTIRLGDEPFLEQTLRIARHAVATDVGEFAVGLNFRRAIEVEYGELVVGLPGKLLALLREGPDLSTLVLAVFLGGLIFWYLDRATELYRGAFPPARRWLQLIAAGTLLFILGYAIFLTNDAVGFTAVGQINRTAMASSLGVAFSITGAVGWLSALLPAKLWRQRFFASLVAAYCVANFLVVEAIAGYWVESARQQRVILTDIQQHFPTLPAGATFLLDGVCPYVGPVPVFEHQWDLMAALQLIYREPALQAAVVTPRLRLEDESLSSETYGFEDRYPYGSILIYDFRRKQADWLTSRARASQYFAQFNPDHSSGCPRGLPGFGGRILGG
jgi:hypothetical protein